MKTPAQNKAIIDALMIEVQNHCMCMSFEEGGKEFTIWYPDGFRLQGLKIANQNIGGRAEALRIALTKMEAHWKESL